MPTRKVAPYRGSFMLVVDSKTRKVDVGKLREEIGAWLAARPALRTGSGVCRTIQGPGNVVICDGGCTKPGYECEPKRQLNGTYKCVCQKRVTQSFSARSATRPVKAKAR